MDSFANNIDIAEELNIDFGKAVLPVTVFVGMEACVGFFGNVLVLYVFAMKYHKCNFKYFVLFLALIDLISCLTTIPGEMVTQRFWYTYPVPKVCKAKSFFNVFTVCASALCLLLIAIDRYRKICKPFGWQVKPKTAIYLCICALVIAGIVATPVTIYWGVQHYNVTYINFTVNVRSCETDEKYKNTEHPLIYSGMTETLISIPLVIMAVLYSLIACKIRGGIRTTRTAWSGTADSLERSDTVTNTSDKGNVKISEAGKLNEDGTDDERNEDKDPYTSITAVDGKGYELKAFPGKRSEDMLQNPERTNTEVEKGMDSNAIVTIHQERVDFTETKSKRLITEENDQLRSVSAALDAVHVNLSDGKRTISSAQVNHQIKQKTLIMFILSVVFIISTILYLTLLSLIARKDNILRMLTPKQTAVYFFFFRFYFIHHVINPFVYFFLDTRFKTALREMARGMNKKTSSFVVTNETLIHQSD